MVFAHQSLISSLAPIIYSARAVICVAAIGGLASFGAPRPAEAQQPAPRQLATTPNLTQTINSNWVRLELLAGRINVQWTAIGDYSRSRTSSGRTERLAIQWENGVPTLHYDRKVDSETLSIRISGANQLKIVQSGGDAKALPFEFEQKPGKPISLKLGSGDDARQFNGQSLWHLLLAEPDVCRDNLNPILDRLHPQWKLTELGAAIEKELVEHAATVDDQRRSLWLAWVKQLGSEEYSQRAAADRQLRAAGPSALSFLERLDNEQLDTEQQFRVRRIIRTLSINLSSGAEQIAAWLGDDPDIWFALLSRPELATRVTAAGQLSRLLGKPIAFDPNAETSARATQLTDIHYLLEANRSRAKMMEVQHRPPEIR